jgi:hypothetical protein
MAMGRSYRFTVQGISGVSLWFARRYWWSIFVGSRLLFALQFSSSLFALHAFFFGPSLADDSSTTSATPGGSPDSPLGDFVPPFLLLRRPDLFLATVFTSKRDFDVVTTAYIVWAAVATIWSKLGRITVHTFHFESMELLPFLLLGKLLFSPARCCRFCSRSAFISSRRCLLLDMANLRSVSVRSITELEHKIPRDTKGEFDTSEETVIPKKETRPGGRVSRWSAVNGVSLPTRAGRSTSACSARADRACRPTRPDEPSFLAPGIQG